MKITHKDGSSTSKILKNTCTNLLKVAMATALSQGTILPITKLGIGKGLSVTTVEMTAMEDFLGEVTIGTTELIGTGMSFKFAELGYDALVGETLSELGLLNESDELMARVIDMNPIIKTNTIRIEYNWVVNII